MLVRAYLASMHAASVEDRIEAVRVMVETYLSGCLSHEDQQDAETALMITLDDPALAVRRALAECLAEVENAPRALILPLAHDMSAVAAHVLLKSPVLTAADLMDVVQSGDCLAQTAIALRPSVARPVATVIARSGQLDAITALICNDGAELSPEAFLIIATAHQDSPELRGVMLEREDLPMAVRQLLLGATARALQNFAVSTGWLSAARAERCVSDAERHATVEMTAQSLPGEVDELVDVLCKTGRLTPNLLLRAVLCGETTLFTTALARLSNLPRMRVAGMVADPAGSAMSAAYDRAGMPASLKTAFVAALQAVRRARSVVGNALDINIIRATLVTLSQEKSGGQDSVLALLRRYEAEAMRSHARSLSRELMQAPASIVVEPAQLPLQLQSNGDLEADSAAAVPPDADNDVIEVTMDDRFEAEERQAA